ncbi:MAG: chemotaxis protein, partial [Epsilonproteobacteria bacterium]
MNKLSVKNRLLFLSITTVLVIFAYSIKIADSAYSSYINSTKTYNIVELAIKLSSLLHELQKERGASAGFLSSKDKKFANILFAQQTQTDKRIKELKEFYKKYSTPEMKIINKIDLNSIQSIRKKVRLYSIDIKKVVDFYTLLNKEIVDDISYFFIIPKDAEVKTNFNSFVIFIRAKEKAGVERAVLARVFEINKLTSNTFNEFSSLVSQQQTLLDFFCDTAIKKIKSEFQLIKKDPSFLEVQRIRKIALSKKENFGVNSLYWFKTT